MHLRRRWRSKFINLKINDAELLLDGVHRHPRPKAESRAESGREEAAKQVSAYCVRLLAGSGEVRGGTKTGVLTTEMSDIRQDKKLHLPRRTERRSGSL
mgnify:CR=1 FL=1